MIQKITNTDDDADEDAPVTEHGPRTPRQFQQPPPPPQAQLARMKISNDGADRDLVNRFKQGWLVLLFGLQLHQLKISEIFMNDEDPRYRGGHIPSRIFWMLEESGTRKFSFFLVVNASLFFR